MKGSKKARGKVIVAAKKAGTAADWKKVFKKLDKKK